VEGEIREQIQSLADPMLSHHLSSQRSFYLSTTTIETLNQHIMPVSGVYRSV